MVNECIDGLASIEVDERIYLLCADYLHSSALNHVNTRPPNTQHLLLHTSQKFYYNTPHALEREFNKRVPHPGYHKIAAAYRGAKLVEDGKKGVVRT